MKLSNESSPTEKLNLNTSDNTRNVKLEKNEPQNITSEENTNESKNEFSVSDLTPKTKFISQLQVTLITTPKNDQTINKDTSENSKIEYDSFLNEFYLKANPHAVTGKNHDMSWEQFSVNDKFNLSDMVKIDPNLAEFNNATGSIDDKMKYLILKLGELAEENETLKKHVDWLTDKYNQQNVELEKQFLPLNDCDKNIETKDPEEMIREYYKLSHKYHALNNHLDDALRHKESYKKALILTKSEKDSLEKDLIQLNDFDDDRERMSELLNIQSTLRLDLKNSTDRNTGLRQEIKCLNEENFRLRQELRNSHKKLTELTHKNENQKHELESLQTICNSPQEEINKNINLKNSYNNSKSWFEQVLDEENYDSQEENSTNETDLHNSHTDISLDSVSSGE